ncbi:MAG: DNA-directed RNA polymerase subunit omega [Armatimonadota bacterium]
MIYPSGDKIEAKVASKYSLVIAVSKRAKQLKEGAPKLIETKSTNPITIALEEIAAGKVQVTYPNPDGSPVQHSTGAAAALKNEQKRPVDTLNVTDIDDLLLDELDHEDLESEDTESEDTVGILEEYPLEGIDEDDETDITDLIGVDEDIDEADLVDQDDESEEL